MLTVCATIICLYSLHLTLPSKECKYFWAQKQFTRQAVNAQQNALALMAKSARCIVLFQPQLLY